MNTLDSLHARIEQEEELHRQRIISYCEEHGAPPPKDVLHDMERELKQRLFAVSDLQQDAAAMALTDRDIQQAIEEGVETPLGLRRIEKNNRQLP